MPKPTRLSPYEREYHARLGYRESWSSQRNRARLAALLAVKSSGRLLEIGCGMGGFLRLAERHFTVQGMDISHYAIQSLRRHFGRRVAVGDIEQQSFAPASYDAIVVFNILEHLRQPDAAIQKLYAALRPGGVLIGSMPNNFGLVGGLVTWLGNRFDRTHVATYPPARWRNIFAQAGFSTIAFFGEANLGRNHCLYLRGRAWPYLSFNLMFSCQKQAFSPTQNDGS